MRESVKNNATIEESKEFHSGYRAGEKAREITNDFDKAHHLINIPKYILNDPDDNIHIAYGMGFDLGFGYRERKFIQQNRIIKLTKE
jgi:hypothetical protein